MAPIWTGMAGPGDNDFPSCRLLGDPSPLAPSQIYSNPERSEHPLHTHIYIYVYIYNIHPCGSNTVLVL